MTEKCIFHYTNETNSRLVIPILFMFDFIDYVSLIRNAKNTREKGKSFNAISVIFMMCFFGKISGLYICFRMKKGFSYEIYISFYGLDT